MGKDFDTFPFHYMGGGYYLCTCEGRKGTEPGTIAHGKDIILLAMQWAEIGRILRGIGA